MRQSKSPLDAGDDAPAGEFLGKKPDTDAEAGVEAEADAAAEARGDLTAGVSERVWITALVAVSAATSVALALSAG